MKGGEMKGAETSRKRSNLRLALILASIALVFFVAVIAKRLLGS